MTKFTDLKNQCIALISNAYATSEEVITNLNSEQIKNPELIYEGDLIKLLDPNEDPIEPTGKRQPLPPAPKPTADSCDSETLVDVLYVPSHPLDNKKHWFALSKCAVKAIVGEESGDNEETGAKGEKGYLDSLVIKKKGEIDYIQTMQNLGEAGVLSMFSSSVFEEFMSAKNADKYKTLNLFKWVITRHLYRESDTDKEAFDRLYEMVSYTDINIDVKNVIENRLESSTKSIEVLPTEQHEEARENHIKGALNSLHKFVLQEVNMSISSMEEKAIEDAEDMQTEDKTNFVYSESLKYFTSKRETDIAENIEKLNQLEKDLNLQHQSHGRALRQLKAKPRIATTEEVLQPTVNGSKYYDALKYLNTQGFIVKEQCLTIEQLEGKDGIEPGPECLNELMPNWRDAGQTIAIGNRDIIDELYKECGESIDYDPNRIDSLIIDVGHAWPYYPTLAVIALMDATIIEYKKNINTILGASLPGDDLFHKLLWIKKVATRRLEQIRKTALSKINNDNYELPFKAENITNLPAKFTLLWDLTYKPERYSKPGFINKAELNNIQIVECSLLSTGEVFYLRGPAWYMPRKVDTALTDKAAGHVIDITDQITFNDSQTKGAAIVKNVDELKKKIADKDFIDKEQKIDILMLSKQNESVFWSDSYHYQNGLGSDDESSAYAFDAGAQLFRFTTKAEASLNDSLKNLPKTMQLGGSGEISAQLTLLQAQASVTFWLPFKEEDQAENPNKPTDSKPTKGFLFRLHYNTSTAKDLHYDIGQIAVKVEGSVYGMAAASCQLSAKVAFGPSDTSKDNFGIKGSAISKSDPNIQSVSVVQNDLLPAKVATDGGLTADAFLGVEAGGSLGATVYWSPAIVNDKGEAVNNKNWQELGSINGEASVAYGIGFNAEYRVVIESYKLMFVCGAKLVFGPGASGKVAIEINIKSIDQFVDALLGVLKMHDFQRLSVFGEEDENGVNQHFVELNKRLTFAMALGLSIADVFLLPISFWVDYQHDKLSKEYAPFFAKLVLDPNKREKIRPWVAKLPPETLANLLGCLVLEQEKGWGDEAIEIAILNQDQASAIVQIMKWLHDNDRAQTIKTGDLDSDKTQTDKTGSVGSAISQWRKALIRMDSDFETLQDERLEWQSFTESWFELADFVKKHGSKNDSSLIGYFNDFSNYLCQSMVLVYQQQGNRTYYNVEFSNSYNAYPRDKIQPNNNKENTAVIDNEEYIITDWSIK